MNLKWLVMHKLSSTDQGTEKFYNIQYFNHLAALGEWIRATNHSVYENS